MLGITSFGYYIPKFRIKIEEIAKIWGKRTEDIQQSLNIFEKSVSGSDEDSLTMAFEATSEAFKKKPINKQKIKAIFFGSETHPYAVNPASTILGEFLGIEGNYLAYDTEFACKAATAAMISGFSLIKSGYGDNVLIAASDKATGRPHDALEYTAASGAVSLILGKQDLILEAIDYDSFSSDTPDFWRREGIRYPSHGGRFTGKPSYFFHITQASKIIFKKTGLKPDDFKLAVFHMPNGKFPYQVALSLGFTRQQIEPGLVIPYLGNCYSASALLGLMAAIEQAKKNDLIYFCSYGSGAGSDAFVFKVKENTKPLNGSFQERLANKQYIDYPTYLKFMNIL